MWLRLRNTGCSMTLTGSFHFHSKQFLCLVDQWLFLCTGFSAVSNHKCCQIFTIGCNRYDDLLLNPFDPIIAVKKKLPKMAEKDMIERYPNEAGSCYVQF
jgi:hypothetical protein